MKKSKSSLTEYVFFGHEYSASKYGQLSLDIDFIFIRVINPYKRKYSVEAISTTAKAAFNPIAPNLGFA